MEKDVERNHKAFEHIYNYAFENIFNDFKKKWTGPKYYHLARVMVMGW